ncbi:MAG: helix-turn-helix transcriptional regulator [Deltaproteobacteria bacterium]|nr:helix-turn-helix transcriptional regulator [Deltaproteobacteria bacterium]
MARLRVLVGRRLKDLRRAHGLSQETLAEKAGLSLSMVSSIERGLRFPSAEVFEGLAKAMKVETREFFDFRPRDEAGGESYRALVEVESMLKEQPPKYIRMVGRIVKELKKG